MYKNIFGSYGSSTMAHQMFFKGIFTFYNTSNEFWSLTNGVCMQASSGSGHGNCRSMENFLEK